MQQIKKNNLIQLEIDSIGFEGISIARKDDIVYFVKNALPGDIVRAEIIKKKKNYIEANTIEILTPSQSRTDAKCSHFGVCGGCSWQNLNYIEQLNWKQKFIIDSFERIARIKTAEINDTLPSPDIYHYRNKMEFSFGTSRWLTNKEISRNIEIDNKNFALGLHIPRRYDKVLDIEECFIQPEAGNIILKIIRKFALTFGICAYHPRKHSGFLRNLIIRTNKSKNQLMVILITSSPVESKEYDFLQWYKNNFKNYLFKELNDKINIHNPKRIPLSNYSDCSIICAINDSFNPVATGSIHYSNGKNYITEIISGIIYKISPFSFFQTNSVQLERLVELVINSANIDQNDIVFDFYCGAGTFTLHAAKKAFQVFGFELSNDSIEDAKYNAELNKIDNVKFFPVDLHSKNIKYFLNNFVINSRLDDIDNYSFHDNYNKNKINSVIGKAQPDIILIDPPRAGIHKNLIDTILKLNAERIIYISCNPATLARDCNILSEKYDIKFIQPVDMFPHTFHIESVTKLQRKQ